MIAFALVMFVTMKTGLITRPIGIGLAAAYVIYLAATFFF